MGGGGMGPISVTPIGGSGRSVRFIPATEDSNDGMVSVVVRDRFESEPTVTVVVAAPAELDVVVVDTIVIDIVGNTAARPGNFDMIDGEPV